MNHPSLACPYCQKRLEVTKAACGACGLAVEARFRLPRVALLPHKEAEFLAEYILAGCSIKDLEKRMGMSYPAVRARLDRVIASMKAIGKGVAPPRQEFQKILDRIERGEMSAEQAAQLIESL